MSKKVLYCPDCDVEFTVRYGMSDSHYVARHCVFCGEEINNDDDFDFNQDFEIEEGTRSPGWIRYQKRIK